MFLLQATQPEAGPLSGLSNYKFHDYVFSVLGNLLSNAIVAAFLLTGIGLYYLQKKFERLQADKDTHVAYAVAQHRRKEQTLTDFTDGIPQNLSMVTEIFTKRSYLRRMAKVKPEERERYLDGRSYRQISLAYERDLRVWLTQCQHFTSLCTQVRSRFDSPEIHLTADRIRELFELLTELTPSVPVVKSVLDQLGGVLEKAHLLDQWAGDLRAASETIAKTLSEDGGAQQFDRVSSNRTMRVLTSSIDKLFMQCVEQMSAELRKLPVAGLAPGSKKWKQVQAGMKADLQADQMVKQGVSMHEKKQMSGAILLAITSIAAGLMSVGCANYGGSVPIDDDAGMHKEGGSGAPPGSVNASVPIDDDAGLVKENAPKP